MSEYDEGYGDGWKDAHAIYGPRSEMADRMAEALRAAVSGLRISMVHKSDNMLVSDMEALLARYDAARETKP